MNPFLGRSFEAMDPPEWLARRSDHIPEPGQRRTGRARDESGTLESAYVAHPW